MKMHCQLHPFIHHLSAASHVPSISLVLRVLAQDLYSSVHLAQVLKTSRTKKSTKENSDI